MSFCTITIKPLYSYSKKVILGLRLKPGSDLILTKLGILGGIEKIKHSHFATLVLKNCQKYFVVDRHEFTVKNL